MVRHLLNVLIAASLICMAVFVVAVAITAPHVPLEFAFACLAIWLVLTAYALVLTVMCLVRGRWFGLLAPLVPILTFFASIVLIPYAQYPTDYVHFLSLRSSYDDVVNRLPENGRRYAEFPWGGMLFASYGVVYDETDEVALPYGRQSADWKKRMSDSELTCGGGPVGNGMPLGGHYYLVGFTC